MKQASVIKLSASRALSMCSVQSRQARQLSSKASSSQQKNSGATPVSQASGSDARDGSTARSEDVKEKLQRQDGGKKTMSELDADLQSRMEAMSGGSAGVQYENGQAAGLRREVKRNMFRVIG